MKIMNPDSVEMLVELDRETYGTLVLDLIQGYRADLPTRMSGIQNFFKNRDAKKLAFEAHAIKATFANFGAATLSSVLQRIELSAKADDWVAVSQAMTEMEPLVSHFNSDIDELEQRAKGIQLARTKAS